MLAPQLNKITTRPLAYMEKVKIPWFFQSWSEKNTWLDVCIISTPGPCLPPQLHFQSRLFLPISYSQS